MTPKERPRILQGNTYVLHTGCGHLYITVNYDKDAKPYEVLARMGRSGGCVSSQIDGIGRLISAALQHGTEPQYIIKQLKGIRCPSINKHEEMEITSCSDAFAKALEWDLNIQVAEENGKTCPSCKTSVLKKVKNNLVCEKCGFERAD